MGLDRGAALMRRQKSRQSKLGDRQQEVVGNLVQVARSHTHKGSHRAGRLDQNSPNAKSIDDKTIIKVESWAVRDETRPGKSVCVRKNWQPAKRTKAANSKKKTTTTGLFQERVSKRRR